MSPTKTKSKPVFVSTDATLRLVRIPRRRKVDTDTGESYVTDGHTVEFIEGRYSTDDKEVIKWLQDHPQNGPLFVERGNEPDRPLPETGDLLTAIVNAVAAKDGDKLAAIYLQERQSHSRPAVLDAARSGLEAIDADVPPPDPVPEHQLERVRPGGSAPLPGGEDARKVGK
jgi:hypothetical protein